MALQPEHIGVVGGGEVVTGHRRGAQGAPTVSFDVAVAEGDVARAVVQVPGLVADPPSGRLRLLEIPLQREGAVVDGLRSFLEEGQGLARRELHEVGEAPVDLRGRSLDARAHEGAERNRAHPGQDERPEGDFARRRAFPQGGVLDVGSEETLFEEEGVRAVGPGQAEPSFDPGFAQWDVFAVEIGWQEIGVIVGVQSAGQPELPDLRHALSGGGSPLGPGQGRQDEPGQDCDDGDDHQELNQGESLR